MNFFGSSETIAFTICLERSSKRMAKWYGDDFYNLARGSNELPIEVFFIWKNTCSEKSN